MEKFIGDVISVNSWVVVDRNAVTGQGSGTTIEFALALVEKFRYLTSNTHVSPVLTLNSQAFQNMALSVRILSDGGFNVKTKLVKSRKRAEILRFERIRTLSVIF